MRSMWDVLRAVLIAGLIAGTATALFHALATEPVIEQAIALEEARDTPAQAPGAASEEPVVSREMQRNGLIIGLMLYGVFFGLLFGVAFPLLEGLLPPVGTFGRAILAAAASFWALGLFPFLRYPANPPGVGQPETIELRQTLFLVAVVAALVGLVVACGAARRLARRDNAGRVWASAMVVYGLYCLALYLILPANPDPTPVPDDLLAAFRGLSLLGLVLFWSVFGLVAGVLLRYFERGGERILARP